MPTPLEEHGWTATILAAVLATIGAFARKWLRNDKAETQIHGGYASAFGNLVAEVKRLAAELEDISIELGRERAARREAEERAIIAEHRARDWERKSAELTERIAALESRVDK